MKSSNGIVHLLSLATLFPALGFAQAAATTDASSESANSVVKLSVFEVTTSSDVGYQSLNAAGATRMDTPIENIPMNVTIFNQQFIADLLATSSEAILEYEPSAVKTSENDQFMARGSSSVSTNFLNGFAQTSGGTGSQPLANIERIEVIKGPAAVLYGSGGFGGTFNRITKQPRPNPFTSARVILREQGSYRGEIDHGGPLTFVGDGKLLYRINSVVEDSSTYNGIPRKELVVAPSISWIRSQDTKITFEYFYHRFERQGNWEFPVVAGDFDGIRDASGTYHSYGDRNWNYGLPDDIRRITRQVASLDLRHVFSENLQFRSQLQTEFIDQHNSEVVSENVGITLLSDAVLMGRYWRMRPQTTDNFRTRNELIAQFSTGPAQHRLLVGHGWNEQYDRVWTDRAQSNYGGLTQGSTALTGDGRNSTPGVGFNVFPTLTLAQVVANPSLAGYNPNLVAPVNVFDPARSGSVPNIPFRPTLYPDADTKVYNASHEFYINDLISVANERAFLLAGMRYGRFERRSINFLSGTFPFKQRLASAPTVEVDSDAVTSSFGAVWHLNGEKSLTLYGNLNSAFVPEFRLQPDGDALEPLEGNQKEIGLRFNLLEGRIIGLVSRFDILENNVVQNDPERVGYFIQVSGLRSTGTELSLNTRITEEWLVFGGYTNTDSRPDRGGRATAQQPSHRATLVNRYVPSRGPLKGFGFTLGTIYTGSRPVPPLTGARPEPAWTIPATWKFDAVINYRAPKVNNKVQWEVGAKVSNLLDETIVYAASGGRYSADPGREWQLVFGINY